MNTPDQLAVTAVRCPRCGQEEPVDSEHQRLVRARDAVLDAWQAAPYSTRIKVGPFDLFKMVDDAIAAVRTADAESDLLASTATKADKAGEGHR